MNLRFIDWIWHIRGTLPMAPGQSADDAFNRLDPLFREAGTNRNWTNNTLLFQKRDQAAQDKMSVFDDGVLQVEPSQSGPVLRYNLTSRALLHCFLAPLLFLAFAQGIIVLGSLEKPAAKAASVAKKPTKVVAMNPIDIALGAPTDEKPKDGAEAAGPRSKKPSATPAYVFAAIFALLYLGGRILEDRLVRSLFRKALLGAPIAAPSGYPALTA